jgi:hypothetical protein
MTSNRADARVRRSEARRNPFNEGGAPHRAQEKAPQDHLDRRRAEMHAAEGHAGSIPRGNQRTERENLGHRRGEWERLLGH